MSSLLCSLFYGHLENEKLRPYLESVESTFNTRTNAKEVEVLLRFVDDFLYITSSKQKAIAFYQSMEAGHPEYGCRINPTKTQMNFSFDNKPNDRGMKTLTIVC